MDGVWVVVPVKAFARAKARLAGALAPAERERLARWLARRTFDAIDGARRAPPGSVAVVSNEPEAVRLATERGWHVIADPGPDHSAAMRAAGRWVAARDGTALVTVATDLPLLRPSDLDALLALAAPRTLVLASDRSGRGTNAVAVAPPEFPFAFGPDSFRRHTEAARALGHTVRVLARSGLVADLDDPDDLELLARSGALM